jgi:signal transduction histidine kinase
MDGESVEVEDLAGQVAKRERQLAEAQRVAHLGSWEWEVGANHVAWTDELYRIYGLDRRSFGATYQAFLATNHPDDVERVSRIIAASVAHPGPFEFDHRIIRSDGSVRTLHTVGDVIVGDGGLRLVGTCHDVTEQRRVEADRESALSLLRATLESTADGILVVDQAGKVVTFNQKFADLWRIPREILLTGDDRRLLDQVLSQVCDPDAFLARVKYHYGHPQEEATDELQFRDGRVFERWTQPQRLGGKVIGRIWSFRDVTMRVVAEAERDRLLANECEARHQAELAISARDEFLSIAAHELRTPLTSLQLSVQGLLSSAGVPESSPLARPLRLIERQTRRLTRLVNDLLDVSRIASGGLVFALGPVDLAELVGAVTERFDPDLQRARCPLELDLAPAVGRWDRARLDQVITNLLSNAIRYGAGKPITVAVRTEGDRARLTVTDQGSGIAPDRLPRIFDRFERGGVSRNYGGLGLGLYIARRIVDRLGGTLSVESEVDRGSSFTVELPLAGPPP